MPVFGPTNGARPAAPAAAAPAAAPAAVYQPPAAAPAAIYVPPAGVPGGAAGVPFAQPTLPRGIFAGTGNSQLFERGVFLRDGTYLCKIKRCLVKQTRRMEIVAFVEMAVLRVEMAIQGRSHSQGEDVSYGIPRKLESFGSSVKQLIIAATGCAPTDVSDEDAEVCFSDRNPLGGMVVRVTARTIITKKNTEFTQVDFKGRISFTELAAMLTAEERGRYYQPGEFEALYAAEAAAKG